MKLTSFLPTIEYTYINPKFLLLIESHVQHLKTSAGSRLLDVTSQQSVKYQGDFFGLLDDLQVDKKYHHIVMRVNNLHSSADYTSDMKMVIVPPLAEIELLKNTFDTSQEYAD